MRVHIIAVGRCRSGPEFDLVRDYLERFDRTGRAMGLGPAFVVEVEDKRKGGIAAQAELLSGAVPKGAVTMILDERGEMLSSTDFADRLADLRDTGTRDLAILIGGADGLAPQLQKSADFALSLGKMVFPHMLARVMVSEQLYRAASIVGNGPYHRA